MADIVFETVLAGFFDPLVLGGAAVLAVALCSGLVARVIEGAEARIPVRRSHTGSALSSVQSIGSIEAGSGHSPRGELSATAAR